MQGEVTVPAGKEGKSCNGKGLMGASRSTLSLSSSSSEDSWQDALDLDDGGDLDWYLSDDQLGREASSAVMPEAQLSSHDADAIDQAGLPVFTPQDRLAEIGTLTCSDLQDIASDLHGITSGVANLQVDGNEDSRDAVLSRLEDELSKLPAENTAAYRRAVLECPGLVSDKRKMAFLDREDGDPVLAAVRLALYWELRLKTFGPERCFLPMTLNGAMRGEAENMVRWPIHQLLPVNDTAGRAIWYVDISRRELDKYSIDQELMALWYLFEVAMEDPKVLTRGFVFLSNVKEVKVKHLREKGMVEPPAERIAQIGEMAMPIPFRALHICHPTTLLYYILPVLFYMFGMNIRHRVQLHRGSEAKICKELEDFCLPVDRLPVELGGVVVLNMATFLEHRMVVESSRSEPRRIILPDGPAAKRKRCEPTLPISQEAVPATDHHVAPLNDQQEKKGRGRPSDPRTVRAIEARLADPDLSLQGALEKGGFSFDNTNEFGEEVDDDNVTLAQRKNNLSRRVRQEKLKRAAEGTSAAEAQYNNVQDSTNTNNNSSRTAVSGGDVQMEASLLERRGGTNNEGGSDESGSVCSRDSFYDSILELPDTD